MKNWIKRATLIALALTATWAAAQDYPSKPIRLIVPLTAGSGADIAGRIVARHLSEVWKQPVIVENRPGAGGQIGTQAVVKAEAEKQVSTWQRHATEAWFKKDPDQI